MADHPDLTFFCELPADELRKLFSNSIIIKQLRQLNANISMGLQDFSPMRAEIVKKLTRGGIPVTAWLLLPREQGYWTNLDTVAATARRYSEFKRWTVENDLSWAAVGLDLEPSLDRMGLFTSNWKKHLIDLLKRFFQVQHFRTLTADLRALVNQIRVDGFAVETYNFPLVIDERKASSEVLTRLLGTPPLDSDREVLMLYTSFFETSGEAILWSYAAQAGAIGLGSTGGGVDLEGGEPLRSMSWVDLRRDLLIAKEYSLNLYIFSLEGCTENGYLERLLDLDWNGKVSRPVKEITKVNLFRNLGQGALWTLSHPLPLLAGALTLILLPRQKR
jgi:hypothetical protein